MKLDDVESYLVKERHRFQGVYNPGTIDAIIRQLFAELRAREAEKGGPNAKTRM